MFQRKSFKLLPFLMCISTVYSKNFTVNCYPRLTLIDVNEFLNVTCNFTSDDILSGEDFYQISVESSNDQVASCQNFIQIASIEEEMFRVNFVIKGNLVGWSSLKFAFKNSKNETFELPDTLSFGVLRTDGLLQTVFTVVVTILVVINTFVMGLQLDWRVILAIFKKPIAPLIGLFCQFICMPLVS